MQTEWQKTEASYRRLDRYGICDRRKVPHPYDRQVPLALVSPSLSSILLKPRLMATHELKCSKQVARDLCSAMLSFSISGIWVLLLAAVNHELHRRKRGANTPLVGTQGTAQPISSTVRCVQAGVCAGLLTTPDISKPCFAVRESGRHKVASTQMQISACAETCMGALFYQARKHSSPQRVWDADSQIRSHTAFSKQLMYHSTQAQIQNTHVRGATLKATEINCQPTFCSNAREGRWEVEMAPQRPQRPAPTVPHPFAAHNNCQRPLQALRFADDNDVPLCRKLPARLFKFLQLTPAPRHEDPAGRRRPPCMRG